MYIYIYMYVFPSHEKTLGMDREENVQFYKLD